MKGIAHFTVGVAVASCFPAAVRAGADGSAWPFLLGGIAGLLPDTLDFKVYKFFYRHDIEVMPDPRNPNPRGVADAVALAVNRAADTGRPVRIKLDTIPLGADEWQQYRVRFNVPARKVEVTLGPVVSTGKQVLRPPAMPSARAKAAAALVCDVKVDYLATTEIDIFDGPLFEMVPLPGGRVHARFIPWHRHWSHSLVVALLAGLVGTLVGTPTLGAIVAGAWAAHALVDQLGFMGSNLLWPFTRGRAEGLKRLHADEPLANLAAVWFSCLIIFWNLGHALPPSVQQPGLAKLLFWGGGVPLATAWWLRKRWRTDAQAADEGEEGAAA